MDVYLASGNSHKRKEFADLLNCDRLALNLFDANLVGGMPEVDESAETFAGNAQIKADALYRKVPQGAWILADDSGLVIDALDGQPGVRSARFAGVGANDQDNIKKVRKELWARGLNSSPARFVCALAFVQVQGAVAIFRGTCEGVVIDQERGVSGFGYDPIFIPVGYDKTFAELGSSIKHNLSHRANAVGKLKSFLHFEVEEQNQY